LIYPEGFFKQILDTLYEGVYICDFSRKITYWNKAAEKITGYKAEEVIGSHCWKNILMHTNTKGENLCGGNNCPAVHAMKEKRLVEEEVYLKHKEGHRLPVVTRISPIENEKGEIIGAVELFSDNSARIAAFQKIEKLEQLAFIDSLTGIGNRRYTEIKISARLEELSRYSWAQEFGILFIDIDRFKSINDTLGHEAGDTVLKVTAKTIVSNIRENDFAGRWGGEEFVLLISNVNRKALLQIAEKIRALVEQSDAAGTKVTVSVGATLAKRGETLEEVIKRADRLMYESKKNGRNQVTIG